MHETEISHISVLKSELNSNRETLKFFKCHQYSMKHTGRSVLTASEIGGGQPNSSGRSAPKKTSKRAGKRKENMEKKPPCLGIVCNVRQITDANPCPRIPTMIHYIRGYSETKIKPQILTLNFLK